MLYDPASHEPLGGGPWNEARVRASIQHVVGDVEEALPEDGLWPLHPGDNGRRETDSLTGIWIGAAGVVWALDWLRRAGAAELRRDYAPVILRALERYVAEPDSGERVPSLWMGEAGILLVAHRLVPDGGRADRLHVCVRENAVNETNEVMWGAPGTMLAATAMLEWTGEQRWADAWRESADRLWAEWRHVPEHDCELWTQRLYGYVTEFVGPAHGFAGNVHALARGRGLLSDQRRQELDRRAIATVTKLPFREDGLANWATRARTELASEDGAVRVQWCHGAPGIVCALADLAPDDREFTELLLAGGELTWTVGPLAKGPGLCHGTAGNGYALLKLYRRTGDERWLERARGFAMHAIEQVEQAREQDGRGRYSLWTGGIGAALYLWSCLAEDDRFPTIDVW